MTKQEYRERLLEALEKIDVNTLRPKTKELILKLRIELREHFISDKMDEVIKKTMEPISEDS